MAILDELNWIYFPKTQRMPKILDGVIDVFKENFDEIRTDQKKIKSNDVLKILIGSLKDRNFRVEGSKSKIKMPVLYGEKNIPSKYFEVDAFHEEERVVLEVEAGIAESGKFGPKLSSNESPVEDNASGGDGNRALHPPSRSLRTTARATAAALTGSSRRTEFELKLGDRSNCLRRHSGHRGRS